MQRASSPRWLEVTVDGTTLSPRQRVMPAPTAMFAQKAAEAQTAVTAESSADGVPAGFSILGSNSNPPPGYEWTGEVLGDPEATQWINQAALPLISGYPKGDTINGKWYMSGGQNLYEFDPAANTWTSKANLPISRHFSAIIAMHGRLFAFGGHVNTDDISAQVYSYVPTTNRWITNHADMPVELKNHTPVATETHIHLLGGTSLSGLTDSHLIYNPTLNTWTTGAPVPIAGQNHTAVFLDGKIHLLGGEQEGVATNAHYVYDISADTWSTAPPMPTEAYHLAAVVRGKKIHVIEGFATSSPSIGYHIYDTTSQSWATSFPVPTPRSAVRATIINDMLYVLVGIAGDKGYSLSLKPLYYVHVKK